MEDSRLDSKEGEQDERVESDFPLTRLFEKLCPIYMVYGMTYDEFWHGDVYRALFYKKAYDMNMKMQLDMNDYNFWLQGMYVYEAICDASPIYHDFAKKGTKPLPYASEPYGIKRKKEQKEELSEQEIKNGRLIAQVQFDNWFRATTNHFKNIGEGGKNESEVDNK